MLSIVFKGIVVSANCVGSGTGTNQRPVLPSSNVTCLVVCYVVHQIVIGQWALTFIGIHVPHTRSRFTAVLSCDPLDGWRRAAGLPGEKCACRVIQWSSSDLSVSQLDTILQLVQALAMFDILKSYVRLCSDLSCYRLATLLPPVPPILLADTDA